MGDPELPAHVKDELARLQVVTMKAVLLDRTFFARAAHPLRRMMSTVAKRSLDPELDTGPDGPFDRILHNTVEYLLNNFETDLLIFEIALERFSDEIRQHNLPNAQVINELAQSLVAGEFIEAAREDAFEQLAIRITQAGRIPHYIHSFLQSVWVGLMADADVNGLPDEDSYVARLEVAEQLIWSVTPRRPDEMPRLVALLSGLIGALRRGMRAAGLPGAEEKRFLIALLATHARQLQSERLAEDGEFDKLPRGTDGNARDGKHARTRTGKNPARRAGTEHQSGIGDSVHENETRGDCRISRAEQGGPTQTSVDQSPKDALYILLRAGGPETDVSR